MTRKTLSMRGVYLPVFLFLSLLNGCIKAIRLPGSVLDTPEHHYANGMKLYERRQYEKAGQSFTMSYELDPEFAPAYVGLALIAAHKKDFLNSGENLDLAHSYAATDEHKTLVQIGRIRVASEKMAGGDWIEEVEDYYNAGLDYDANNPGLHYYMGVAYKRAYHLDKAGDMFERVLELNSDLMVEADHEWSQVNKIQRAAPGSKIGRQIAIIDKIDRAEVAALLIQELKLDKLYKKRGGKTVSYKGPDGSKLKVKRYVSVQDTTDIRNHVLAEDIAEAIRLDIMQPFPDYTFRPDRPITRAEYAVIVEDIMVKVSGYKMQAAKDAVSPFPDVRNDFWAYNAIVFATDKGIMEAGDTSEFRAHDPVSGADALLIIRKIKDELKFF